MCAIQEVVRGGPASGNPAYIVRKVWDGENPGQYRHYGTQLVYNNSGELWFLKQTTWPQDDCGEEAWETVSIHEFRGVGRNMCMTMQRQEFSNTGPYDGSLGLIDPETRRWYDYDGDEFYADAAIAFDEWGGGPPTVTEQAAHEPGIGSFDYTADSAGYRHGDQIGSTRAITGPATLAVPTVAEVTGRIVYTAFGERVWSDGTVGTRYQYAGSWGYQSDLYEDASGNVPFIHVGYRWYDPASGRFLQRDPIGIAGGLNSYAYALLRPTMTIDASGLSAGPSRQWTELAGTVDKKVYGPGCTAWLVTYEVQVTYNDRGMTFIACGAGGAAVILSGVVLLPISAPAVALCGGFAFVFGAEAMVATVCVLNPQEVGRKYREISRTQVPYIPPPPFQIPPEPPASPPYTPPY